MAGACPLKVSAMLWAAGGQDFFSVYAASASVLGLALAKDPSDWVRSDALVVAHAMACFVPTCTVGATACISLGSMTEDEWLISFVTNVPFAGANSEPVDRYARLALIFLGILREPSDLPEAVHSGVWHALCWMPIHLKIEL